MVLVSFLLTRRLPASVGSLVRPYASTHSAVVANVAHSSRIAPTSFLPPENDRRAFSTSTRNLNSSATATLEKRNSVSHDAFVRSNASEDENTPQFASLKGSISHHTFQALTKAPFGYKDMSDVQHKVFSLLPGLAHPGVGGSENEAVQDLLVKAKTGTGKTLAFLVPAIERRLQFLEFVKQGKFSRPWKALLEKHRPDFDPANLSKSEQQLVSRQFASNTVGTLILSPTRELATQIAKEAEKLQTHHEKLDVQLLVGGESRNNQLRLWKRGRPDVVVATPGRMLDLLTQEAMVKDAVSATQTLIFDEADTLLDMGFKNEIDQILSHLPDKADRQTMLFSATVGKEIQAIAKKTLSKGHIFIDCVPPGEENVHEHIPQSAQIVEAEDQFAHVGRLLALDQLQNPGKSKTIVFLPTTINTKLYARILRSADFLKHLPAGQRTNIYELHGGMDQARRFKTSSRFRADKNGASVLVTTDVSARGVDYPGTTRVIQIGSPVSTDQYIHRIGRTGRAGATGRADLILLPWEAGFVHNCLDGLPVTSSSSGDVVKQLELLAKQYDDDPAQVIEPSVLARMVSPVKPTMKGRKGSSAATGIASFGKDLHSRLQKLEADLFKEIIAEDVDEEEARQAFMSQCGYYLSRNAELATSKYAIIDGLKDWISKIFDMQAPYLSDSMLAKFGVRERKQAGGRGGSRRFDRGFSRDRFGGGRDRPGSHDSHRQFQRGGRNSGRAGPSGRSRSNRSNDHYESSRFY